MTAYLVPLLAVVLAYLIGAVPFAYLVVYAVRRVDIRTVGSGNVGATNAGRLLGFRYFLLVFALDLAKGYLPTLWARSVSPSGLAVFVAVAAILGHNFPIYLRFRGGKGVATSLGALFALDPIASGMTAFSFVVFLLVTRYVSLSSIMAGLFFFVAHFLRVPDPWSRDEVVMSVATIGLMGMLLVRHRKNLVRIVQGTEPKVTFRKKKTPPAAAVLLPLALALAGSGSVVAYYATRPARLDCGAFVLEPAGLVRTGHQRADRLTFADGGKLLAVTCPRYCRVVLYRVEAGPRLSLVRDVRLEGRPVDVKASRGSLFVLERPYNDARHLEEAFWERFDFTGNRQGDKYRVGYDPDDMLLIDDDRTALVLLSGNAEGEMYRPKPSLKVIDLSEETRPRVLGELVFAEPMDDPHRLAYDGSSAFVSLRGSNQVAWVDLSIRARPRILGRSDLPDGDSPAWVGFDLDGHSLAVGEKRGNLWRLPFRGREALRIPFDSPVREATPAANYLVATCERDSTLEVLDAVAGRVRGALPLRGTGGLGRIVPVALARGDNVLAVADRSGGVHLISLKPKAREALGVRTQ
jgi:glycerol-3-phosphate acyltransferase PlsY